MLNTVYRLVEPRRFEAQFTDIDISKDAVLVRPTHLSICHADQRYYQGTRSKEILAQKLPMALIHEAIGQVEYDPEGEFEAGTYVVMVPNTPYETDPYIGENDIRFFHAGNPERMDAVVGLKYLIYPKRFPVYGRYQSFPCKFLIICD